MILFKACPRCEGEILETGDQYGPYFRCLQCGYTAEQLEEPQPVAQAVGSVEETGAA